MPAPHLSTDRRTLLSCPTLHHISWEIYFAEIWVYCFGFLPFYLSLLGKVSDSLHSHRRRWSISFMLPESAVAFAAWLAAGWAPSFPCVPSLALPTALWGRSCHYAPFMGEGTETQRDGVICPQSHSKHMTVRL